MESFDKLFSDFSATTKEVWKEKVIADLKGKDYSELVWQDVDGLSHMPYYDLSDRGDYQLSLKVAKGWSISQTYYLTNWSVDELNAELEYAFQNGLEKAFVHGDERSLAAIKKGENIFFCLDQVNLESDLSANVLQDPIGAKSTDDFKIEPKQIANYIRKKDSFILIDGSRYASVGAKSSDEIAFILWHLTDYLDILSEEGIKIEEVIGRLMIKCSIGPSYLTQMAKFRALRYAIQKLLVYYDCHELPILQAESNAIYLDTESHNTNLIRLTTQAMSAVLGNADHVSLSMQAAEKEKKRFAARMNRNIQLLLKHESHLDEVDDLLKGAYYVEQLSKELFNISWESFKTLESKGSFVANIHQESIWKEFEDELKARVESYKSSERVMVGVNKYQYEEVNGSDRLSYSQHSISEKLKEGEQ